VATPVGFWACPFFVCMNEGDAERWVRLGSWSCPEDVARADWGWLGGGGARERERSREGNTRGAEGRLCALAWSERQRRSVGLEVACLRCYQSGRREGGLGCTHGAAMWGSRVGQVLVLAW
jgi:hypothetical protein